MTPNRYFAEYHRTGWAEFTPPNPPEDFPHDLVFWGMVLEEFERLAPNAGLNVVVTWNSFECRMSGKDTVVIHLGQEAPIRASYTEDVLVTFRTMPWDAKTSVTGIGRFDMLSASLVLKLAYNIMRHNKQEKNIHGPLPGTIVDVPLGVFKWEDVDATPMVERPVDCVFLGSLVGMEKGPYWRRTWIPKTLARADMVKEVEKLMKKRPDFKFEFGQTSTFGVGTGEEELTYTQKLCRSKVGLSPMGSAPESFRFFELMRAGTIPLTNPLPKRPFYEGHPGVEIDRFDQMERVMDELFSDMDALQKRSDACREYFEKKIAPKALARMMVESVQKLRADLPVS